MTADEEPFELLEGLLLRHAACRPHSPAVVGHDRDFTWLELLEAARGVAAGLSSRGVVPGDRVALRLGNTGAFVAAAMGCIWLGATFLPLSVDDPPERARQIIDDCHPALVVQLEQPGGPLPEAPPVVALAELYDAGAPPAQAPDPAADAYIIYTSGTTGSPKGVRISRSAFAWSIDRIAGSIGLGERSRSLCVSAFHFDGSYTCLFATLWAGGTVVVARRDRLLFVTPFFRAVSSHSITHSSFSPSYLRLLLRSPRAAGLGDSQLVTLGLGGEECRVEDLRGLWDVHPSLRVFNLYGPTETTLDVTTFEVDPSGLGRGSVPIGRPHRGVSFHLAGEDGAVIEGAGSGELHIGGRQLMTGYWGDAELTGRVMTDRLIPGTPLYRTGDIVRREPDGLYYYVGRADDVVKRHGVRISLGEIEAALRAQPGVDGAACACIDIDGKLGIAAFAQAPGGADQLRSGLARLLPATMIPDRLYTTEALPLNSSGKTDRGAAVRLFGCVPWRERAQ